MRKKKVLALILALMCTVSVFSGCGSEESEKTASDIKISGVNEFPIVEEKIELDVFAAKSAFVADFETNEFTKWYEEKTGVHINWIVPSGDAQQSFNLMIASGEYPDVILGMGLSREQVMSLVSQGVLVDIKDEIEEHGYYIKKMFEEEPSTEEYVTINGAIYGVPNVNGGYSSRIGRGMWIYQPWLDKLGIETPQTTEDFYQMLKAFKEQDPNGNGKADEIPFCGRGVGGSSYEIESYLMSAFIPTDGNSRRYVDENGKIQFTAIQPEYREGLRYFKKLYDEGLLYQDTFIIDRNQLTSIGESEIPILGASTGSYPGYFCSVSNADRYYGFVPLPPLEGPDGVRATVPNTSIVSGHGFMVTKECKYPDIAVKWVDWLLSFEGTQKTQDQGLTYLREAKEGELGLDGQQALWTVEQESDEEKAKYSGGQTQNLAWHNCGIWYNDLESSIKTYDPLGNNQSIYYMYTSYTPYAVDNFPLITIAEDDVDEYTDYQLINDEVNSYFVKFVTGELDIDNDKDWNGYIKTLEGLGLKEYMKLLQRNYDRDNK